MESGTSGEIELQSLAVAEHRQRRGIGRADGLMIDGIALCDRVWLTLAL